MRLEKGEAAERRRAGTTGKPGPAAWGSLVEGGQARQGKLAATQLRKFRPSGKQGAAVRQRHKEYWVVVEAVVLL